MNNTALILKQDGKIYALTMPSIVCQRSGCSCEEPCDSYPKILQERHNEAISSAVLCDDQEQAKNYIELAHTWGVEQFKSGHPYVIPGLTFTPEYQYREKRPVDLTPIPWKRIIYTMDGDGVEFRTVALLSMENSHHTIEDPIPAMLQQAANTIPGEIDYNQPIEIVCYDTNNIIINSMENPESTPVAETKRMTLKEIVEEVVQVCKEHAEDGCFDHEGAEANALRILERRYASQLVPIQKPDFELKDQVIKILHDVFRDGEGAHLATEILFNQFTFYKDSEVSETKKQEGELSGN